MKLRILPAFLAIALAGAVDAAPTAVVEGVQMPAWVERGAVREPLAPGMELRASDRISTGANSRILLRLAEGSQVKLGENALLSLDRLAQKKEEKRTLVQAALDVARGAFRFTTDARNKIAGRREVDIRIATVTAGVRGTDLWGKSAGERDIVCLIEGKISVQRESEAAITLDQALQFYIAPKSGGQRDASRQAELATVSQDQLRQWSAETEIAAGQGAARRGGKWKVVAASEPEQSAALAVYDKLREAGYAAAIVPRGNAAARSYVVRISGLPSKAEAAALAARVAQVTGREARAVL